MKTKKNQGHSSIEKNIDFDNDIMKAKLNSEFGMKEFGSSLTEEAEKQWLNYVYDFEKMYKDAKQIKVYDFIGKPDFKKLNELSDNEISAELDRLTDILNSNNIELDLCCEYEDKIIYQFITEELFEELTDDMRIEGMRHCFIYEEFHPNHDYDIRYLAKDFFEYFLKREWDDIHADHHLSDVMKYNDSNIERKDFVKILHTFRKSVKPVELEKIQIDSVDIAIEQKTCIVKGMISYIFILYDETTISNFGKFKLGVCFNDFYWEITEVEFPGFK
ncbi:MAG: hypothetical protein M3R36_05560 [Bacteroidota bacterium]|nr:hypothetical protein [Bacteroidota bacterium]